MTAGQLSSRSGNLPLHEDLGRVGLLVEKVGNGLLLQVFFFHSTRAMYPSTARHMGSP